MTKTTKTTKTKTKTKTKTNEKERGSLEFDPGAAAAEGSGIFGLPHDEATARVVLIPVPFEATTSYGGGTAKGPAAILAASRQVDLFDRDNGRAYEAGIHMLPIPAAIARWDREGRRAAAPVIAAGGARTAAAEKLVRIVDERCERVNAWVRGKTAALLDRGKIVGVLGGDHCVPFGSIAEHAERFSDLSILHVDAHLDLRPAYEGFAWSHASIMDNVVRRVPGVRRLVQVAIRDFSEEELDTVRAAPGRIAVFFDGDLADHELGGGTFAAMARKIVSALTRTVYVSFDIDGLDPVLAPNTGTPVPGGLSFRQATALLAEVVKSGRRIVGFDLCEVAPDPRGGEWDANVGARILYKLCGFALRSTR